MISKYFEKAYAKQTVNTELKKVGLKTLFGIRLTKIMVGYFSIMALGISLFVIAKKDVDGNRNNLMKVKQELAKNEADARYPSRFDLIKAEKEAERS